MFSSIIGKSYVLTVKNYDDWTFLIFFIFTIVFPLELETRLYYQKILLLLIDYITITTDTTPTKIDCSRKKTLRLITFFIFKTLLAIISTHECHYDAHCVRKSICDSPLGNTIFNYGCVFPPIETLQGCLWYFATLNLTKGLSIQQVA